MTMLDCVIADKDALMRACMPFIQRGGLFVATNESFVLGALVAVHLQLLAEAESLHFNAKVVWITPPYERDQLPEGVGVQFCEEDALRVRTRIEVIDADAFVMRADHHSGFFD